VKISKLAILGLTISFSGVCVFYDHLSDFLQPDFRFGILLSFIATISWAFEVYTLRKAATFNPYFSLVTNADFKLDSFAVTGATGTGVNLMSIPAFHGGPLPTL
jgi:drug/metabolite transporter (DMT)-like permease